MNKKQFTLLMLAAISPQVFAAPYDMEFYTSGNFQMVVDSFKRVSLFYASNIKWIIAIFVLGLMVSTLTGTAQYSQQKISGGNASNTILASMFMAVIGSVVFSAGVLPKGTVHVYDSARNQYESVPGVPAIITLTTGLVSRVVYAFSETENTANAYTYGQLSDGSPFAVLQKAIETSAHVSSHLMMNINSMYEDCGSVAIASGSLDVDALKFGTYNLLTELSGLRHNTIETTMYSDTNPSGVGATCAAAYNSINAQLSNPAVFDKQLNAVCSELGLDTSIATEKITCQTSVSNIFDTIYSNGSAGISWQVAFQNILIAESIRVALTKHNYGDAVNIELSRNTTAGSMGAMEAGYRFIPVVKGALLAVIIGAAPVLLLFVVTPMVGKALLVFFGLFIFYGIWQMLDMVILSAIEDSLYAATSQLVQAQMGLISVWKTGSVTIDAFTTLASARTVSITLAVFITATLFRVSPQALGSFAQKMEGNTEEAGTDAGKNAMLSEKAGETLGGLVNGNANLTSYSNGVANAVRSDSMNRTSDVRAGNITADSLGGSNSAAQAVAEDRAAKDIGGAVSTKNEGLSGAIQSHAIQQDGGFAESTAIKDVAAATGQGTKAFQTDAARLQESKSAGEKAEMAKGDGILDNGYNLGRSGGAQDRATADDIATNGASDAYRAQEQDIARRNEEARAIDKLNPGNSFREYFAASSERETLEAQGKNQGAANFTEDEIRTGQAGDFIDATRGSVTKTEITGGNEGRDQMAEGNAQIETHDDLANIQLRESLKNTLEVDDAELSRMMLGENQYNMTQEQAQKAHAAGIINDEQMKIANKEGALVLDMNATGSPDGKLDVQSTSASFDEKSATNKSTEYDASSRTDLSNSYDESSTVEASTASLNEASSRRVYGDADLLMRQLSNFDSKNMSDQAIATEVGSQSASGLRDIVSFNESDNTAGESRAAITAAAYKEAEIFGFGAKVGVEGSNSISDTNIVDRSENIAAQHFGETYQSIDKHYDEMAKRGEITEAEARQQSAETYAGYYSHVRDGMAANNIEEFDRFIVNGSLGNVWEDYQDKNGLNIANHNERNDKPEVSEDEKKYGFSQSGMASGVLGSIASVGLDASTLPQGNDATTGAVLTTGGNPNEVQGASTAESTNQNEVPVANAAFASENELSGIQGGGNPDNGNDAITGEATKEQGANVIESSNQNDVPVANAAFTSENELTGIQGGGNPNDSAVAIDLVSTPSDSAPQPSNTIPVSASINSSMPVTPAGNSGSGNSLPPQDQQNASNNMPPVERAAANGNLPPIGDLQLPSDKRDI